MNDHPDSPDPDTLPPVPPPEPDVPSLRGQRHGITLARVTAAALLAKREDYPNYPAPCEGCVFREGTGPNMSHPRVQDAMKAVLEKRPMVCNHRGGEDGTTTEPCAGWMVSLAARIGQPPMDCPWPYSWEGPGEGNDGVEHLHAGTDGPGTVTPSHVSSAYEHKVQHAEILRVTGTVKADVLPFIHPEPKGKQ